MIHQPVAILLLTHSLVTSQLFINFMHIAFGFCILLQTAAVLGWTQWIKWKSFFLICISLQSSSEKLCCLYMLSAVACFKESTSLGASMTISLYQSVYKCYICTAIAGKNMLTRTTLSVHSCILCQSGAKQFTPPLCFKHITDPVFFLSVAATGKLPLQWQEPVAQHPLDREPDINAFNTGL